MYMYIYIVMAEIKVISSKIVKFTERRPTVIISAITLFLLSRIANFISSNFLLVKFIALKKAWPTAIVYNIIVGKIKNEEELLSGL